MNNGNFKETVIMKKLSVILLFAVICISLLCVSCNSEQDNISQQSNFDQLNFNIEVNNKLQYNRTTRAESQQKEDWATGDTIYMAIDKSNDNVCYMVYGSNQKWTVKAYNDKTSFTNQSGTLSALYSTHIKYGPTGTYDALTCGDILYTNDGSYTKSGNIVSIHLNMSQRPLSRITIKGVDNSFWVDNCTEYVELKSLYPVQWWTTSNTNGAYNKVVGDNNTSVFYGMIQPDSNNNTIIILKNKNGVTYTRTYDGKTTETGHSIIINGPLSDEAAQWTCNIPVNGISLNTNTLNLCKGDNATLTATISPADASNKNVTWSTSNSDVATVSPTGEIKAVGIGTTTVTATATDGNYVVSCTVSVKDITDYIALSFIGGFSSINGYIYGSLYSQITNNSSNTINLTKFTITDALTNKIVAYKDNIGDLPAHSSTNLGTNFNGVYEPIFTWTYTFNGETYTISKQHIISI